MTGQVEEQVRVQLEHKKALQAKLAKSGVAKSEELTSLTEEISKLQELLKEMQEKSRRDEIPFDYPKREF